MTQDRQTPRVVVVTGASGGIGRATAEAFGRRGDTVVLLARGETGLAAAAKQIEADGGTALAIPTDVADSDQVEAAAEQAERQLGPIDVWVNVAFTSVFAPFDQIRRRSSAASPKWPIWGTSTARWPRSSG